jgi:tetratricopeptide (TPR) repeat protein
MGLFGKMFGGKSNLEKIQRALAQKNYVDALHLAEDLRETTGETQALIELMEQASDGLARLNFAEGVRSQEAGQPELAVEHLRLALSQARAKDLLAEIDQALRAGQDTAGARPEPGVPGAVRTAAGCGSCAPAPKPSTMAPEDFPDLSSQIELLLASYPPQLQQRYQAASTTFLQAFWLIHQGEDQQALAFLNAVPGAERDDLYLFESGCVHARLGDAAKGLELLKQALVLVPGNLMVLDALLQVLTGQRDFSGVRQLLQQQLALGSDPGFCQARISESHAAEGDHAAALSAARLALEGGYAESGFLVMAAELFEEAGQIDIAERLLSSLPSAGCGGGLNLPLAELLLRQKRELGRVLDAFNGACRQEPDNPRWQLRVAQTYLARKWRKQGLELLARVSGDPRLAEPLRLEAQQLLSEG